MNHLSLCSGIGGLDLAAEWAGFRTIAQCEIDEYASRVLAKNFKGVPNLHDIRTVTNRRLAELGIIAEEITVVSAGFPCQPYSLAGKGRGDRDERDLWGEVVRVLGEIRPPWFVGENTQGLFSRENQRYFRRILSDLAALGYSVAWGIWGAVDVGAPHKRERVFIVAYTNGERRRVLGTDKRTPCGALGESEAKAPLRASGVHGKRGGGALYQRDVPYAYGEGRGADESAEYGAIKALDQEGRGNKSCGADSFYRNISDTLRERSVDERIEVNATESGQSSFRNVIELYRPLSDATGDELGVFGSKGEVAGAARCRDNQRGGAEGNASGEWWQVEPDVGRVAHGIPARVDKLRCLGNAVVPYQALPIFEAIAEFERSQYLN